MPAPNRAASRGLRSVLVALVAVSLCIAATAFAPAASAAVGEFQGLASSPVPVTSVTVDPSTNIIYAQENGGNKFFSYDPSADEWKELAEAPLNSGNNGGATFLNGKVYTSFTGNSSSVGVYDVETDTWTTIANPLERGTADITAVGGSIYMAEGTRFVKYEPVSETTTELANAPDWASLECGEGFERWGGLQPYEGKIYGHQGDGCAGFAVYDIASNSWTELPPLPLPIGSKGGEEEEEAGAVDGSALDPVTGTYYTYGNYGGRTFYRYDIAANSWSEVEFPFADLDDGGMAYVSLPGKRGVYATFGENEEGFTHYVTPDVAEADLSLSKAADVSSTIVGNNITYTIKASNAGPNLARSTTVTDPLPSNVSFVSATASQGSCSGSSTVTCSLGTIASGGSATVTVVAKASTTGTATNTANVSTGSVDPVSGNNSASATTTIGTGVPVVVRPALLPARWLVPNGTLPVAKGWVSDPLVNLNSALTLSGTAQLVEYAQGGKGQVLATNTVFLAPGATKTLYLHLNSVARAKLAKTRRFNVQLQLALTDQFGRQVKPSGVYLLVGPKHKHHKHKHKHHQAKKK
jgi:uncharacterized repeat protein (TIGR01451 family)